jgi:hypothetical protein
MRSPLLSSHIYLTCHSSFHMKWISIKRSPVLSGSLFVCPKGGLLLQVWLYRWKSWFWSIQNECYIWYSYIVASLITLNHQRSQSVFNGPLTLTHLHFIITKKQPSIDICLLAIRCTMNFKMCRQLLLKTDTTNQWEYQIYTMCMYFSECVSLFLRGRTQQHGY